MHGTSTVSGVIPPPPPLYDILKGVADWRCSLRSLHTQNNIKWVMGLKGEWEGGK